MGTTYLDLDKVPDNGSKEFKHNGKSLFAIKKDGTIFVYLNECPHRGVSLVWAPDQFLDDSGTMIRCAHHGALFVIDNGRCIAGPCFGLNLTAVPFKIVDDVIFIE